MRKRTRLKAIFLFTVLTVILLIGAFTAPNIYFSINKTKVEELNVLRAELDLGKVDTRTIQSSNPLDFFTKLESMLKIGNELDGLKKLEEKKASIADLFDQKVASYYQELEEITEIKDYLTLPNIQDIDFQTKKSPEQFIEDLWPNVREAYIRYNGSASTPLRYVFDPSQEARLLSTEEKVGLLFGFAIKGTDLSEAEKTFYSDHNIGTVAIFGHNISNQEQLQDLANQLQQTSTSTPILIATDQEGGLVKRIGWDETGSLKQIEALSDEEACNAWRSRSATLFESGINWNLGTIGDVTGNTSSFIFPRVFSSDYQVAANEVKIASECEGIITTIKHWPGHGSTTVDTHMQLGRLSVADEETWLATDNVPFQAGIENGAETIMVGQLLLSWLNNDKPATLSTDAINYLRNDLNYQGAIVTDDMMMLTRSGYSIEDATREALIAGNDLVFVVNNDISTLENLYSIALDLVESGQISEEDLNERATRILELKAKVASL